LETTARELNQATLEGFRWLETIDEALETMLQAIDGAHFSIRLEIYIYRVSAVGERFRDALIRAIKRSVRVQVLVDALGSITLPEKFWDPLIQAGGQFRWFNPLKLKRLGFRDHRKLLVVDEKIGFVGGFNIAPEYEGDGVTRGWHDVGFQVPASLARALAASFDALWPLADYRHRRLARYRRSAIAKIISTPEGQLLTSAPGRGPHFLKSGLLNDLQRARNIDIISAYFLPPRQLRRALKRAPRKGRRVRLILPAKSDVRLSQMAARYLYRSLLVHGVEIYEYQPQILHTKLFLFDDVFYVGSANMDKRSLLVNYELLVRVKNAPLVRTGREFFETTLEHCKKIEWESWKKTLGIWNRFQQQWAYFVLSRLDPWLTRLQLQVMQREIPERTDEAETDLLGIPGKPLGPS
jgi:cardiolipin synthase